MGKRDLLKKLLELQQLDLKIEALKILETQIPEQKRKYDIHKKRLKDELEESELRLKKLQVEQHECEVDIEQRQAEILKKDGNLLEVKKNEEYQALLHEIDMLKKQIGIREERIIAIMIEVDEAKAHFDEDKTRIEGEQREIDEACAKIDAELAESVENRKQLELERTPLIKAIDKSIYSRYARIRKAKKSGPAVVALNGESCSGCNMAVRAQVVNEILAGETVHACSHCGRILYHEDNLQEAEAPETAR